MLTPLTATLTPVSASGSRITRGSANLWSRTSRRGSGSEAIPADRDLSYLAGSGVASSGLGSAAYFTTQMVNGVDEPSTPAELCIFATTVCGPAEKFLAFHTSGCILLTDATSLSSTYR